MTVDILGVRGRDFVMLYYMPCICPLHDVLLHAMSLPLPKVRREKGSKKLRLPYRAPQASRATGVSDDIIGDVSKLQRRDMYCTVRYGTVHACKHEYVCASARSSY